MVGQACKMRTNLNRFASLVIIVWWCVLFISHTMSKSLMKSLFQFHVHFREITSDLGRVHITFVRYCLICDTLLHLFIGYAWWGWWLMFQTHIALDDCKICIIMQGTERWPCITRGMSRRNTAIYRWITYATAKLSLKDGDCCVKGSMEERKQMS